MFFLQHLVIVRHTKFVVQSLQFLIQFESCFLLAKIRLPSNMLALNYRSTLLTKLMLANSSPELLYHPNVG